MDNGLIPTFLQFKLNVEATDDTMTTLKCEKAKLTSEREYTLFFSLNRDEVYQVKGIDYQQFFSLTRNNSAAEEFCLDLIKHGQIQIECERLDHMYMSIDGIRFTEIANYCDDEHGLEQNNDGDVSAEQLRPISTPENDENFNIVPPISGLGMESKEQNGKKDTNGFSNAPSPQMSKSQSSCREKLQQFRFDGEKKGTPGVKGGKSSLKTVASYTANKISRMKSPPQGKSKQSPVWRFFVKVKGGGDCKLCGKFAESDGTTNLFVHLRRQHKDDREVTEILAHHQQTRGLKRARTEDYPDDPSSNYNQEINDSVSKPSTSTGNLPSVTKAPKRQVRIDNFLGRIQSFKDGGTLAGAIKQAVLYMIVKDEMPLSCTEKEGLRNLLSLLASHWEIPKKKAMTNLMEQKYSVLAELIKNKLNKADNFTITTDIWTDTMTTRGFLGFTIHFLYDGELDTINLDTILLTERRTAEYVSLKFEEVLTKWAISKEKITAIVTDGGSNMKKAVKDTFGADKHMICFAHRLNTTVNNAILIKEEKPKTDEEDLNDQDSQEPDLHTLIDANPQVPKSKLKELILHVKKIVTFFKQSTTAADALRAARDEEELDYRVIQEVCTRWNSTYYMLERFLKLADKIGPLLLRIRDAPLMLTRHEVEQVEDVVQLLLPAEKLTKEISAASYVSTSKVIPSLCVLRECFSEVQSKTALGLQLQKSLLAELDKQFKNWDQQPLLAISTVLDPRFKRMYFPAPLIFTNTVALINKELVSATRKNQDTSRKEDTTSTQVTEDSGKQDDIWRHHRTRILNQKKWEGRSSSDSWHVDLQQYINKENVLDEDPIKYWKSRRNDCPRLAEIALKYLSTVATSVPCERLFSRASAVTTPKRNRLNPEHLSMLIFLKSLSAREWRL